MNKNLAIYEMKKIIIPLLFTLLAVQFSCNKDNDENDFKHENASVWLSGGLAHCAEQLRLDNGDTLIVHDIFTIYTFKSGDRVSVKYKEIGINENCYPYIDCEIVEIKKIN